MNGFILVDKPQKMTSQTAVLKIKRMLGLKKCGHSGTLDPDTTGLLVVACDQATKLMKLINEHNKEYITTITFGYDSNTLDLSGTIIEDFDMKVELSALDEALMTLKRRELQTPPMVSAIKMNGKKLYEYERKNIAIEIPARKVKIYELERLSGLRYVNHHYEVDLRIVCSKGFYVRSFARDLGELLNGKAVMSALRRVTSGQFNIKQAVKLEEVTVNNIIPIEEVFNDFEKLEVNDYIAGLVSNGVVLDERQIITNHPFYVLHNHDIIALYEPVSENKYKPLLIFKEER